ncbi:mother cell-specific membrane sporulation protein [Bacillus sp. NPDC077027]|uniref:mother cell-specific membrane sporulation protein n=1 Tax=Bacillus sp. NPDC077027 TaxID=3390548 RepID=UPI003D04E2A7
MHEVWQFIIMIVIIGMFLYIRMNRISRFQPVRTLTLFLRIYLFGLTAIILLAEGLQNEAVFIYALIGASFGGVLAAYSYQTLSLTLQNGRLYFKTSKWVEVFILCLFLSRLTLKLSEISRHPINKLNILEAYQHIVSDDALTMMSFFLLATYYIGFSYWMMKANKRHVRVHSA